MPRDLGGICLFDIVLAKVQALATVARVEIVDTFYVEPWEELLGSKHTPFAYNRLAVLAFSASNQVDGVSFAHIRVLLTCCYQTWPKFK